MDNSLYRTEILDHYEHPRNFGKPSVFTHTRSESNHHCGDEIQVYLNVQGNRVEMLSFEATGCAVSIASASILTEALRGKTITEILTLSTARVSEFLKMNLTPTRLKCALLPVEAIKRALIAK